MCSSVADDAQLSVRGGLRETRRRRREFKKASGILSGLWEKIRERPHEFLDQLNHRSGTVWTLPPAISWPVRPTAVRLFEQLYIRSLGGRLRPSHHGSGVTVWTGVT